MLALNVEYEEANEGGHQVLEPRADENDQEDQRYYFALFEKEVIFFKANLIRFVRFN